MVFGSIIVSSPRGNLSPQQLLELANVYLENANRVTDNDIALVLCHDTEESLSQARKSARRAEDQVVRDGVATAYINLGKVLDSRRHHNEAQISYKKAEKLEVDVHGQAQLAQSSDSKRAVFSDKGDPMAERALSASSLALRKRPRDIA
ncbi:hypothetical protein BGZ65_008691, partial [Modicella reniformis]